MFNFSFLFYCSTNGKTATWFCRLTNQEASAKFCYFTNLALLLGELGAIGTVFLFNDWQHSTVGISFTSLSLCTCLCRFAFWELEGWVFVLMCLFLCLGFSVFND